MAKIAKARHVTSHVTVEFEPSGFDHADFLKSVTKKPGVYRMLDGDGAVLYVGKAKNLKNRLTSYFRKGALDAKTMALVSRIASVQLTVTRSETEALLLEQSLIKEYRPPYNIDFKDDKSYPYIYLTSADEFPRLAFHRGSRKRKGRYFGPYPSAGAVRDTLGILQKVFRVRQCEDSFFRNRSRPCLQYQINRCSGPCCDLISAEEYQDDVRMATLFLTGKSGELIGEYQDRMEEAAQRQDYEKAAAYRDQIDHLRRIQEQQYVVGRKGEIDLIAVAISPGAVCVEVMFVRGGRILGSKEYFPKTRLDHSAEEFLAAFITRFYLGGTSRDLPREIILSDRCEERELLEQLLQDETGRRIRIASDVRGHRARWLDLARANAQQSLVEFLGNRQNIYARFEALQEALALEEMPERLECFDISHSAGEATVASCVVFDRGGPVKSDYRRFNIDGITPGDDYAAMAQVLERRYTRVMSGEGVLPDILFIDGGKGQLHEAERVLEELQVSDVTIVAVAKGPGRKAGLERVIVSGRAGEVFLTPDSPALHLIQHIRDESHRFAIAGHRQQRARRRNRSPLEGIDGVGPKRRRALLRHFGGLQQVMSAAQEEIEKVEGVSRRLAAHIYAALHEEDGPGSDL